MKNLKLSLALLTVLMVGMIAHAKNQQAASAVDNPLRGKVVLINPSSISTPHDNARIEELAGKKFLVYTVKPEDGNEFASWIAIDEVSRLLVFNDVKDAKAYLKRPKTRRPEDPTDLVPIASPGVSAAVVFPVWNSAFDERWRYIDRRTFGLWLRAQE